MAPEAEGSNPFTHPIYINCAPVAQLDRVADFESVGRRFESYRACQNKETFFFILGLFKYPKGHANGQMRGIRNMRSEVY